MLPETKLIPLDKNQDCSSLIRSIYHVFSSFNFFTCLGCGDGGIVFNELNHGLKTKLCIALMRLISVSGLFSIVEQRRAAVKEQRRKPNQPSAATWVAAYAPFTHCSRLISREWRVRTSSTLISNQSSQFILLTWHFTIAAGARMKSRFQSIISGLFWVIN